MTERLNERIAERVRALRGDKRLSLDALASKSGVSRSMISLIERGESSATAVVLERVATALGVTLASLFDPPAATKRAANPHVSRRAEQSEWKDPASGYVRRNVSPPASGQPLQIVEVCFPANGRVAFENGGRELRAYQQVWVLEGTIEVAAADERYRLHAGDCFAMQLDKPTMFHNPTRMPARYAVVIASEPAVRR